MVLGTFGYIYDSAKNANCKKILLKSVDPLNRLCNAHTFSSLLEGRWEMMLSNPNLNIFEVKVIISCLKKYYVCNKKKENCRGSGRMVYTGRAPMFECNQQCLCTRRKDLGADHS